MTTATHTDTANWLSDAHAALEAVEALYVEALASVRARVSRDDKLSAELIEADQHAAHGLSWFATYKQGLSELVHYAERLSAELDRMGSEGMRLAPETVAAIGRSEAHAARWGRYALVAIAVVAVVAGLTLVF